MCYFSLCFPNLTYLKICVYSQHKFLFSLRYFASAILQILLDVLFLLVNHSLFGKIRMEDMTRIEETRQVTYRILCLQGNNISYKKKNLKIGRICIGLGLGIQLFLNLEAMRYRQCFCLKPCLAPVKNTNYCLTPTKFVLYSCLKFDWKIGLNLDLGSENIIRKLLGANYRKRELFIYFLLLLLFFYIVGISNF